jgi:hypothetical protein
MGWLVPLPSWLTRAWCSLYLSTTAAVGVLKGTYQALRIHIREFVADVGAHTRGTEQEAAAVQGPRLVLGNSLRSLSGHVCGCQTRESVFVS